MADGDSGATAAATLQSPHAEAESPLAADAPLVDRSHSRSSSRSAGSARSKKGQLRTASQATDDQVVLPDLQSTGSGGSTPSQPNPLASEAAMLQSVSESPRDPLSPVTTRGVGVAVSPQSAKSPGGGRGSDEGTHPHEGGRPSGGGGGGGRGGRGGGGGGASGGQDRDTQAADDGARDLQKGVKRCRLGMPGIPAKLVRCRACTVVPVREGRYTSAQLVTVLCSTALEVCQWTARSRPCRTGTCA